MAEKKAPVINPELCIGCGACVAACPHQVLEMKGEKSVVAAPLKCEQVKACIQVCPVGAITFPN